MSNINLYLKKFKFNYANSRSRNNGKRIAFGHEFELKPYTVLKAGHWCPECLPPPWNSDEQAKRNPFFAQVWYPNHEKDENNYYPNECYKDILD